jgi:hypothetical protein
MDPRRSAARRLRRMSACLTAAVPRGRSLAAVGPVRWSLTLPPGGAQTEFGLGHRPSAGPTAALAYAPDRRPLRGRRHSRYPCPTSRTVTSATTAGMSGRSAGDRFFLWAWRSGRRGVKFPDLRPGVVDQVADDLRGDARAEEVDRDFPCTRLLKDWPRPNAGAFGCLGRKTRRVRPEPDLRRHDALRRGSGPATPRDRLRDCDSVAYLAQVWRLGDRRTSGGQRRNYRVFSSTMPIMAARSGGGGMRTHDRGCPRCRFSRCGAGHLDEFGAKGIAAARLTPG